MQQSNEIITEEVEGETFRHINLLDHGLCRFIDSMGSDRSVVRNARVSYKAAWRKDGKDEGLIDYLMRNHHTSPFEAVKFTMEIKAPIFVFRQWHRHRTWSYNELSARYKELPEVFYIPEPAQVGKQSKSNKQMRDQGDIQSQAELLQLDADLAYMRKHNEAAFSLYRALMERGMPRELARSVLPLGTYSHMFATVDLHNLFGFLRLRDHEHSQYEIQVYARAMLQLIRPVVPACVAAFEKHG